MKFLLLILLVACSSEVGKIPRKAPNMIFYDLEGDTFTLNQDKKTILIFFAQWCSACKSFLSDFSEFTKKNNYSKSNIVLVNVDKENDIDKVKSYLAQKELDHFKLSFSGNGTLDQAFVAVDAGVIPSIYVLEKGQIIAGGHSMSVIKENW